jgi:hypothetical protein
MRKLSLAFTAIVLAVSCSYCANAADEKVAAPAPATTTAPAAPAMTEEQAVTLITKLGGSVDKDEKAKGNPVYLVNLRDNTEITDADLACLKAFPHLQYLDLSNTKTTDAAIPHLVGLKELKNLNLADTALTDAGLAKLKVLTTLKLLDIMRTKVTDAGEADFSKALPECQVDRRFE